MKYTQYTSKKIASMLKSVEEKDGKYFLKRQLKGFMYAECKPYDAACIVNVIVEQGSQIERPNILGESENCVEEYVASTRRRIIKVCQIRVHSIILLPTLTLLPKDFLSVTGDGEVTVDYAPFMGGKQIDYAHSSKGDFYFKNGVKGCQIEQGFPFYFNASDAILTAINRA